MESLSSELNIAVRPGELVVARMPREYVIRRLLAVADMVALLVGFAAGLAVDGATHGYIQLLWALLLVPVWIVIFKLYGLYDRDGDRVSHSTIDDVPSLVNALFAGAVLFWLLSTLVPSVRLPSLSAAAFLGTTFLVVCVMRAGARTLANRLARPERVLLVGGGPIARLLIRKIRAHPEYGLDPIGYVEGGEPGSASPVPCLGSLSELEEICRNEAVDRVIVASPRADESALADLVRVAAGLDVRISILPHLSDVLGPSVTIDEVEGLTLLGVNPPALTPSSRLLKRTMDLVLATTALLVLSPLLVLVAVLVKATSRGPVLYTQERVGRDGRRFRIYKFRTMVPDADQRVDELKALSDHPVWLLLDHDPRVTRVGRTLRRTSIDELPQLWNVIAGDMSLVGPRPMPPEVDEQILGWGRRRLSLTPGITGLWQVLGRTSIPFEEMVKLDYLYVANWSLWYDVKLLVRTLPAVLSQRGVN